MTEDCRIIAFDGALRLAWYNESAADTWSLDGQDVGEPLEVLAAPRGWSWVAAVRRAQSSRDPQRLTENGRVIRVEPASAPGDQVLVADLDLASSAHADAVIADSMWRRLGKMASVVAHEVKNPLAGVSGALHVIAGRFPANSPERQIVEEMQSRLGALNSTIDELLLFARPLRLRSSRVPMAHVLERSVLDLRKHPDAANAAVQIRGVPPSLRMDADLICRAIRNLLVNAVQASEPGADVGVDVETHDGELRLWVWDQGRGVPDEVARRMFDPFFTRKSRGPGLGLTVARRIVEAHDGTLELDRDRGPGTHLRMVLPLG